MLTSTPAWTALQAHHRANSDRRLHNLFADDPDRAERFWLQACGLTLDYSKNHIDSETLRLLIALAEQQSVAQKRDAMFRGDILNITEQRSVLHTALRSPAKQLLVGDDDVMPPVHAVLDRMTDFVDEVRNGRYRGYSGERITDVVNIGIGGSDLGPKMAATALRDCVPDHSPNVHFVSNIDSANFREAVESLNPASTLFVIASKTFTTRETLLNARLARDWFTDKTSGKGDVARHFVAISTALTETRQFGIDDSRVFEFWEWVGGRYSLWSAIGLSLALRIGMEQFRELLAGANAMDEHFKSAPLGENMPVLLGLIGIWYNNFYAFNQQLMLTYDYTLRHFAAYIQQLDMESNGKSVDVDGNRVDYSTGQTIWGGSGSDAQHAYMQLVHQGNHIIPVDFIVSRDAVTKADDASVVANFLAQAQALMQGDTKSGSTDGESFGARSPQQYMPGNRPSNAIVLDTLDARTLGSLIALYEHKVFVQGVIWRINSFDQPGVELGKRLAQSLEGPLCGGNIDPGIDSSTRSLINLFRS